MLFPHRWKRIGRKSLGLGYRLENILGEYERTFHEAQMIVGPRSTMCVQGQAKKTLLSSVTRVPSGLMGCALAAEVSGQKEGGKIQTCMNFFARPCKHLVKFIINYGIQVVAKEQTT